MGELEPHYALAFESRVISYFSVPTGTLVAPHWILTILQACLHSYFSVIWIDKCLFWQVWTFSTAAADIAITIGMMAIVSLSHTRPQLLVFSNDIALPCEVYFPVQRDAQCDLQNHPHRITNGAANICSSTARTYLYLHYPFRRLYFAVCYSLFPGIYYGLTGRALL
jgi:hypothetical protein